MISVVNKHGLGNYVFVSPNAMLNLELFLKMFKKKIKYLIKFKKLKSQLYFLETLRMLIRTQKTET